MECLYAVPARPAVKRCQAEGEGTGLRPNEAFTNPRSVLVVLDVRNLGGLINRLDSSEAQALVESHGAGILCCDFQISSTEAGLPEA